MVVWCCPGTSFPFIPTCCFALPSLRPGSVQQGTSLQQLMPPISSSSSMSLSFICHQVRGSGLFLLRRSVAGWMPLWTGWASRRRARAADLWTATHLLQLTEDAELVRRRGRWVSSKVMEIYLQEIAAAIFFPNLPPHVRENVLFYAHAFPAVLQQSASWTQAKIPTSAWYRLWLHKDTTCNGVNLGKNG